MGAKRRFKMRTASLFVLLAAMCVDSSSILSNITNKNITGVWYEVAPIPADVSSTFRFDTTWYEIRELNRAQYDEFKQVTEFSYEKEPLTFDVVYSRGGRDLAYIYTPKDGPYCQEIAEYSRVYKLIRDYSRDKVFGEIKFEMPDINTLWIYTGGRPLTLIRAR
jgi:lipocalin